MKPASGMGGSMTMAVPKPTPMAGIVNKPMSGADYRGKSGTTSGGNMTGCSACGTATKAIPTPKTM